MGSSCKREFGTELDHRIRWRVKSDKRRKDQTIQCLARMLGVLLHLKRKKNLYQSINARSFFVFAVTVFFHVLFK